MTWVERNTGLIYPWWRTSTVDDSDVDGVYQAVGAGFLAKSYLNMINQGINDLSSSPGDPAYTNADGWDFSGAELLTSGITGTGSQSALVKIANTPSGLVYGAMGYRTGTVRQTYILARKDSDTQVQLRFGYNASSSTQDIVVANANSLILGAARNRFFADGTFIVQVGTLDTWSEGIWKLADPGAGVPWVGLIQAAVIYNRQLTDAEMAIITNNMRVLGANHFTGGLNANYIVQNSRTKHLSSFSHELLIATDGGIYRTFNGGRSWGRLELPDPSNAEFGDAPAATVDELTFHWCAYDPLTISTLYVMAAKALTSRFWIYKSTNNGVDWSSRGVDWT